MNHSGAIPEPFTSDSITVQFSSVEVSQVQKGSRGTTHETTITSSPGSPASIWNCRQANAN